MCRTQQSDDVILSEIVWFHALQPLLSAFCAVSYLAHILCSAHICLPLTLVSACTYWPESTVFQTMTTDTRNTSMDRQSSKEGSDWRTNELYNKSNKWMRINGKHRDKYKWWQITKSIEDKNSNTISMLVRHKHGHWQSTAVSKFRKHWRKGTRLIILLVQ